MNGIKTFSIPKFVLFRMSWSKNNSSTKATIIHRNKEFYYKLHELR